MDSLNLSRDLIGITPRTTPAVPKLITSNEKDEKEVQYYNTDGSSDEDSESENSSKHSKAPQMGLVIKTTDLFKPNQGLKLLLPASPSSFRSSQGSFGEDDAMRSIAIRPKNTGDFGSSPSRPGAIPIPSANLRNSSERFGASPASEPTRLAPDEHGNEIPPDAKWTRINRRLVSPEVLEQDHRRYEACPEWVAVLGVLSRAEIESYAARSAELREARRRRTEAVFPKEVRPPQPPRPVTIPRTDSKTGSLQDTPSSSDTESSDSNHHRRHRNYNRGPRSYTPSDINVPVSGYPNPFGQPVPTKPSTQRQPSPNWNPVSSVPQPVWMANPPQNISASGIWVPAPNGQGGVYYPPKEKERERERSSRRHYSHHSHHSHSGRNRDRDRDRERERDRDRKAPPPQKVSRWKENLTAAGIGGAAVSLLNVLTEAAEGL
jgi:hypothetical protein